MKEVKIIMKNFTDVSFRIMLNRKRLGLTQKNLAVNLGISRSIISAHENGSRKISKKYLSLYNSFFKIDLDKEFNQEKKEPLKTKTFRLTLSQIKILEDNANEKDMDVSTYLRLIIEDVVVSGNLAKTIKENEDLIRSIFQDEAIKYEKIFGSIFCNNYIAFDILTDNPFHDKYYALDLQKKYDTAREQYKEIMFSKF